MAQNGRTENDGLAGKGSSLPSYRDLSSYIHALLIVILACFSLILSNSVLGYGDTWVFAVLMLIPTYLSGSILVRILYRGQFKPVTLISSALLFWYFAPLSLLALGLRGLTISLDASALVSSSGSVAAALGLATPLIAIECRRRSSFAKSLASISPVTMDIFLLTSSALQLTLIASGTWTYGVLLLAGSRADAGESATAVLQLVNLVAVAAMPLSAYSLGKRLSSDRLISLPTVICFTAILIGIVWHFIGGRRYLAVEMFLSGALYLSARYRRSGERIRVGAVFRLAILFLTLTAIAWPAYLAVRIASQSVKNGQNMPSISELIRTASEGDIQLDQGNSAQVIDRSAIITSFSRVAGRLREFSYGEGIAYSFVMAIPPQISFIDKRQLPSSLEALWRIYGVPLDDYSNSLILDSFVDFGYFGYVVYLLFALGVIYSSLALCRGTYLAISIVQIAFVFQFLNGETSLTSYIVFARNGVVLLVVFFAISLIGETYQKSISSRLANRPRYTGATLFKP